MRRIGLAVLVIFLAALTGGFFWWQWAMGPVIPKLKIKSEKLKAKEEVFVVKKGEGVSSVAERLEKEGLIRSKLAFRILVAKEGLSKKIQAGDFRLNKEMALLEIAKELTHGTLDVWVTIPEGWRREQVASRLNSEEQLSGYKNDVFLQETKSQEGRLFPDTYLIPKEATTGAIMNIFLKNFEKKLDENLRFQAEKRGLTIDQVLTLAAIVEREAGLDQDRPIIAGILLKRWQNNWPLQADATVQYAVAHASCSMSHVACNWWPKNLTKQDLKINSPYNTYEHPGLPPGPICSPGLASIEAVINGQESDFWYYLSDAQGKMHYAATHEEHVENINKYLR